MYKGVPCVIVREDVIVYSEMKYLVLFRFFAVTEILTRKSCAIPLVDNEVEDEPAIPLLYSTVYAVVNPSIVSLSSANVLSKVPVVALNM